MADSEYRAPEPRQRTLLFVSALAGCVLLYLSTDHRTWGEFAALLFEVVGTALVLVVVMDFWFSFLKDKARQKDEEHRQLGIIWKQDQDTQRKQRRREEELELLDTVREIHQKIERLSSQR
jgi:hypothetical protein